MWFTESMFHVPEVHEVTSRLRDKWEGISMSISVMWVNQTDSELLLNIRSQPGDPTYTLRNSGERAEMDSVWRGGGEQRLRRGWSSHNLSFLLPLQTPGSLRTLLLRKVHIKELEPPVPWIF